MNARPLFALFALALGGCLAQPGQPEQADVGVADLTERAKVNADQHWNNHDPDEEADRQIDVGEFHCAYRLENRR